MQHTKLTDDLQEQASLYAAGAMTGTDRAEYARHLEDDRCPVCLAEVRELESAMSMLAFSSTSTAPSATVRERLMEQARGAAPRTAPASLSSVPFLRRRWLELIVSTAAIGALVVAASATRANNELKRLTEVLTSRISQLEVQIAQNQTYIATLTSPDVRVVPLAGQGLNVQASAKIFWDQPNKKWFLYVRNLPRVPADKSYELWFVPKSGNPLKAAVFNTEGNGAAELEIDDVPEGVDLRAAAVTTEPAGGLDLPSGPFALLGAL
jgi:anti-sigma-K factor RskA